MVLGFGGRSPEEGVEGLGVAETCSATQSEACRGLEERALPLMRRAPKLVNDRLEFREEGDEVELMNDLDGSPSLVVSTQHEWLEESIVQISTELENELLDLLCFLLCFYLESRETLLYET